MKNLCEVRLSGFGGAKDLKAVLDILTGSAECAIGLGNSPHNSHWTEEYRPILLRLKRASIEGASIRVTGLAYREARELIGLSKELLAQNPEYIRGTEKTELVRPRRARTSRERKQVLLAACGRSRDRKNVLGA
jgi:hypothetical protein